MPYVRKSKFRSKPRSKRPFKTKKYRSKRFSKTMSAKMWYFKKYPRQPKISLGVPDQKTLCRLHYSDTVTLQVTSNYSGEHRFAINSLYDPNATGVGHQCYLYDQLAGLYNRYNVRAVNMSVSFHPTSAHSGVFCYIRAGDGATATATNQSDFLIESRNFLAGKNMRAMATYVGERVETRVSTFIPLRKYKNKPGDDVDYTALFGANPTDLIYAIVGFADSSAVTLDVIAHVNITFFCELTEPVLQSQS